VLQIAGLRSIFRNLNWTLAIFRNLNWTLAKAGQRLSYLYKINVFVFRMSAAGAWCECTVAQFGVCVGDCYVAFQSKA
jgi:hypothetical protein